MQAIAILGYLFFFSWSASASDVARVDITDAKYENRFLGKSTYVYTGRVDIETVSHPEFFKNFQLADEDQIHIEKWAPGLEKGEAVIWFKINFFNPLPHSKTIYLSGVKFAYQEFEIFQDGIKIYDLPMGTDRKRHSLPLTISGASESQVYFRVTPAVSIFFLMKYISDLEESVKTYFLGERVFTVILTIVAMSLLLNFIFALVFKELVYFYYLLYLVGFWVWVYTVQYFAFLPWGDNDGIGIITSFMGCFVTLFSIQFLELRRQKILYWISQFFAFASFTCAVISVFDPLTGFLAVQLISAIGSPFCLFCGLYIGIKYKDAYAYVYCIGFGSMLIGVFLTIASNFSIIENPIFRQGMLYGTTLENILMLVAIGMKLNSSENEKKHSYRQLAKVFYPHQLKKMRSGSPLEDTMPVGTRDACVLAFDIMNSSTIIHSEFVDRFEQFMTECREMLMENYDSEKLSSNGYMIKEMGDGFLCSVGYPFRQPEGSISDSAIQLANKIMDRFHSTLADLNPDQPIMCSIGIARGPVTAYFSKSGAIRHDLWGVPLAHAIRYESIRNLLFKRQFVERSSIISLQESVYSDLSPQNQKNFTLFDLESNGLSIRDDKSAKRFAYWTWNAEHSRNHKAS